MPLAKRLADWVRALAAQDAGARERIERDVRDALAEAAADEIRDALDHLWPLTRHVGREDCWTLLLREARDPADVRAEIPEYLERQPEVERLRQQLPDSFRRYRASTADAERALGTMAVAIREASPQLDEHLPSTESSRNESRALFDDWEARELVREVFPFLVEVTRALEGRVPDDPAFWGVLGAVNDAVHYCDPDGFEERVKWGRRAVLQTRAAGGRADLLDHFMLVVSSDPEWSERAADEFMACLARTATADVEVFFDSIWLLEGVDDSAGVPEETLPNADLVWEAVLSRPDLSRRLLARAGRYYWESSLFSRGPALPLAALAVELEADPTATMGDWSFASWVPCLLLAAFRDAFRRRRRRLAVDCLNRGLLHLGAHAHGRDLTADALDRLRVNADHLYAALVRYWDDAHRSPRFPLYFALEGLRENSGLKQSRLGTYLERVGRLLNVAAVGVEPRLRKQVGDRLWCALEEETRRILRLAEAYWCALENGIVATVDYSSVGIHYRRAIEHEWRAKLKGIPGIDVEGTLGGLAREVLELGEMGRQMLTTRLGGNSQLVGRNLLKAVLNLCGEFLNPAAHPSGLSRNGCQMLREELLDRHLLRRVLGAVQAGTVAG